MLDLKPFTAEAMADIRPLLNMQTFRTCDYTVGGLYMWREYFKQLYTVKDGMLICTAEIADKGTCFGMPVGCGDLEKALLGIKEDRIEKDLPLRFCCITKDSIGQLTEVFGRPSEITASRDFADYLYPYENFLGYHGKKLVTQRNHCNRFRRDYPQFEYRAADMTNIDLARSFLIDNADTIKKAAPIAQEDYIRAVEVLDHFDTFGFTGGILSVDGRVIGFTAGEAIGDTLYVHIEKALTEYSGAYPMLASLYAKQSANEKLRYINREDDSGDAGLRWSKTEYRPCEIIEKYIVCFDM